MECNHLILIICSATIVQNIVVTSCKLRLDLIRQIVTKVLRDLKNQASEVFKDLQDWLGARFLKEMER